MVYTHCLTVTLLWSVTNALSPHISFYRLQLLPHDPHRVLTQSKKHNNDSKTATDVKTKTPTLLEQSGRLTGTPGALRRIILKGTNALAFLSFHHTLPVATIRPGGRRQKTQQPPYFRIKA